MKRVVTIILIIVVTIITIIKQFISKVIYDESDFNLSLDSI